MRKVVGTLSLILCLSLTMMLHAQNVPMAGVIAVDSGTSNGLILLPPSPVSNKITVDLRLGVVNQTTAPQARRLRLYLDDVTSDRLLAEQDASLAPQDWHLLKFPLKTDTLTTGMHRIVAEITDLATSTTERHERPLEVLERTHRSTDRIDGAFAGFYHWSEQEGRLWNEEIKTLTAEDWGNMMRAMHEVGMDLLVPQEAFRYEQYVDKHNIPHEGYLGKAFYPSRLYPDRMDIVCDDPLEACLQVADELEMSVFLPIGLYAWFDFAPDSLVWHKNVASEMWKRYGHHKSVYGFYVSEEIFGSLGASPKHRAEIVTFFREFTAYCRKLAPERPVMLAPNCHDIDSAEADYPKLLANLDILCPFGFHRMPWGDPNTGEQAAEKLQHWCDAAGSHLWLDMEAFLFKTDQALYPRPVGGLIEDFRRFPNFEKIVCYQFPGIFNAPWATKKPGGADTVKLFLDYKKYLESHPTWQKREEQ